MRSKTAHAGSQARVTSMGGVYDAATLHALMFPFARIAQHKYEATTAERGDAKRLSNARCDKSKEKKEAGSEPRFRDGGLAHQRRGSE